MRRSILYLPTLENHQSGDLQHTRYNRTGMLPSVSKYSAACEREIEVGSMHAKKEKKNITSGLNACKETDGEMAAKNKFSIDVSCKM